MSYKYLFASFFSLWKIAEKNIWKESQGNIIQVVSLLLRKYTLIVLLKQSVYQSRNVSYINWGFARSLRVFIFYLLYDFISFCLSSWDLNKFSCWCVVLCLLPKTNKSRFTNGIEKWVFLLFVLRLDCYLKFWDWIVCVNVWWMQNCLHSVFRLRKF